MEKIASNAFAAYKSFGKQGQYTDKKAVHTRRAIFQFATLIHIQRGVHAYVRLNKSWNVHEQSR